MLERKLYRLAVLTCVMGLLSIAVVIVSGTAYPEILFQVLAPIGLLLIFVSLVLYVFAWVLSVKKAIKSKDYLWVGLLLLVGIILLFRWCYIVNH